MKRFAKIFETPIGQVVAMQTADDDGDDVVRLYFDPQAQGVGVCNLDFVYGDEERAAAALAGLTAERAVGLVGDVVKQARNTFGAKE